MKKPEKYLKRHGTVNVPTGYVINGGFKLGEWQTDQVGLREFFCVEGYSTKQHVQQLTSTYLWTKVKFTCTGLQYCTGGLICLLISQLAS